MSASLSRPPRVGVWLIGARGSVATTVVAGCAAVTGGLHPPTGLVTESPAFADSDLPALSSLVFGGHDTSDCPLPRRAEQLAALPFLRRAQAAAQAVEHAGPRPSTLLAPIDRPAGRPQPPSHAVLPSPPSPAANPSVAPPGEPSATPEGSTP
jgi:hypothetical protein